LAQTLRFSSSLRTERLEVTLSRARAVAQQLGISRVTDITRLDCVGVPVFASIRPNALPGSLCVNAGKGISVAEARVGAYMEAIEYAFAEYNLSSIDIKTVEAGEIYEGKTRSDAILDFCPIMGSTIDLNEPMACVAAIDLRTRKTFLVPAELVFLPFPDQLGDKRYFGSTSNGLSSGNSVLEATVHGLAEVIERDICSFQSIKDDSVLVDKKSLPPAIQAINKTLAGAGLQLYVRYLENNFQLPYFMSVVAEWKSDDPIYVSAGYGCHPSRNIALTRSVCEALQSRLSFIHGGRDDLTGRYYRFKGWSQQARRSYAGKLVSKVSADGDSISFKKTFDQSKVATDLDSALKFLMTILAKNGFRHVLRTIYTPKHFPLQVVRIIVPGLECFNETTTRIGPRLRDYVRDEI
jgi:ribosomal protein S12 methylthiotransferase accessory factor